MLARHVFVPVLAALALLAESPAAGAPPAIAVFNIENQGTRLSGPMLDRLTTYLATRVANAGYRVVPREQIKRRLSAEKRRSYRGCYAQSCQIEIGKELAASKSLAAQLLRIGQRCVLTVTLYDLRTAATERAATAKGGCGEDAMVGLIDRAVAELAGTAAAPSAPEARRAPLLAEPPAAPQVSGGALSPDDIRRGVHARISRVTFCYERALAAHPELEGRVVADFTIGARGAVTAVDIVSSTLGQPDVERCVRDAIGQLSFPRPRGGGIVKVRYPFVFRRAQR